MSAPPAPRRRLVGFSTKMYFDIPRTESYLKRVAEFAPEAAAKGVDAFVIPDFVTILRAKEILGSGPGAVAVGAQDCFWEPSGAYTGEVSPLVLKQAGVSLVELGHAERRRYFHETDEIAAKKAAAVATEGLTPLVCIGEKTYSDKDAITTAVNECTPQVTSLLDALPHGAELVLAYEPVWAIGQAQPASAEHVVAVTKALRALAEKHKPDAKVRILYGGSAGPGLFKHLVEGVDGLFLGRFAHDVENFRRVIDEIASA